MMYTGIRNGVKYTLIDGMGAWRGRCLKEGFISSRRRKLYGLDKTRSNHASS